jgi:hypothetical protein
MKNTVNIPSSVKDINISISRRITILAEQQAVLAKTQPVSKSLSLGKLARLPSLTMKQGKLKLSWQALPHFARISSMVFSTDPLI